MGRLAALRRIAGSWYVSSVLLGALGIVLGATVFFYVYPGKPKVGIINIPFTVITDRSAFEISALLEYARRTDSIKAVVIKLNSPGGGAAPSEGLFFETRKLREKKPVVIVMDDVVASGGYMMALGANYTFAKPSTFLGGVGVIVSPLPRLIPRAPSEREAFTGPFKLEGGSRRHYVALTDQLKQAFAQMVVYQRGDKLRMSREDVLKGQIYAGVEGVRLGLVDALGGDTDAIEKAASLAGISGYGLVDINTEVSRIFNEKLERIREPLKGDASSLNAAIALALISSQKTTGDASLLLDHLDSLGDLMDVDQLRRLTPAGGIGADPQEALPDFPLKINGPNVYYLYVGPSE